jgi:hypothetical protein
MSSSNDAILILSASDVARVRMRYDPLLPRPAAVVALRRANGNRYAIPSCPLYTARIASIGTSIKVVTGPLESDITRGLPAATLVLDEGTGAARALIARFSTALRTAAGMMS